MTTSIDSNLEITEFFAWLKTQLPESEAIEIPEPSPELLDFAWQTLQAQAKRSESHLNRHSIQLLAAADGKHNESSLGPFPLPNDDGFWQVEYIPDDLDWKIFKVKFNENKIEKFLGQRITIGIAGQEFELGEVNRRGIAEGEIPSDLDMALIEYIDYGN